MMPFPKLPQRIILATPLSHQERINSAVQDFPVPVNPHKQLGLSYVAKHLRREEEAIHNYWKEPSETNDTKNQNRNLEDISSRISECDINTVENSRSLHVYDKYEFNTKPKDALPVDDYKEKILEVLDSYGCVIVQGPTGCGKSTRIPQFILDDAYGKRESCNIVVVQPRRIAAVSLAKRVSVERGWALGTLVGYQISQDKMASPETHILFCTTGILLQKLINSKNLNEFTHVILDEVHERNDEMDFALILVKKFFKTVSPNTKVILMSATMDTGKFSDYFTLGQNNTSLTTIKLLSDLESRKKGILPALREYFWDDLPPHIKYEAKMSLDEPCVEPGMYKTIAELIRAFNNVDKSEKVSARTKGSVLVFLPGLREITDLYEILDEYSKVSKEKLDWFLLPLHSSISREEQEMVFTDMTKDPYVGKRKIILSTNIAESSITVPDVKYVVDLCLTRELVYDDWSNYTMLKLMWASKTNCLQRGGRTGRVSSGRVYRMVTKILYEMLKSELPPQILRAPLDRIILNCKMLNMDEPLHMLALAMDPPDKLNIKRSVMSLKEVGALLTVVEDKINEFDGDLTYLGRVIARLPMDPRLSKLIVYGHMFGVLQETIIMACAMSVQNFFSTPFQKNIEAYEMKLKWAASSCSDPIAYVAAYKLYKYYKGRGNLTNEKQLKSFADETYLQRKALHEVKILEQDTIRRLKEVGIEPTGPNVNLKDPAAKALFLKIAISAAFYPYYFFPNSINNETVEKDATKIVGGCDPFSTVYMTRMPLDQPGELYSKFIKKYFECVSSNIKGKFENSRVYVRFDPSEESNRIPGRVCLQVYKALKLRDEEKRPLTFPVLNPTEAKRYVEEYKKKQATSQTPVDYNLPWPWEKNHSVCQFINIIVTHVEDPGRFWIQCADEGAIAHKSKINALLSENYDNLRRANQVKVGELYVVKHGNEYQRGRALPSKINKKHTTKIHFVDTGRKEFVGNDYIKEFNNEIRSLYNIPDLAIEGRLCGLQPTLQLHDRLWSEQAKDLFKRIIVNEGKSFLARVYSVVHSVASLIIYRYENPKFDDISINDILKEKKYAQHLEESFLSKESHKALTESCSTITTDDRDEFIDIEPSSSGSQLSVTLKGPFSPLEMSVHSVAQALISKKVFIHHNSVNSVLLNANPQDNFSSIMIASKVSTSTSGHLNLRETTLMPNILGLPALICLLFAPVVELRVNNARTRYTGALCGLGYHPRSKLSIFPDNDMEIDFDCSITLDTLEMINKIREWMNRGICSINNQDSQILQRVQEKIIQYIQQLLIEPRYPQELYLETATNKYRWGVWSAANLMNPYRNIKQSDPLEQTADVYKAIWAPVLASPQIQQRVNKYEEIIQNLKLLDDCMKGYISDKMESDVHCKLCNEKIDCVQNIRTHIMSSKHALQHAQLKPPKFK